MLPVPSRFFACAGAAAIVLIAATPPAEAATSELGQARYDISRRALVVPYYGAFPTFVSDSLTGPPRVFFDFRATSRFRGIPTNNVVGHPSLTKWTMAARGGNYTRLVLQFNRGTQVLVLNDASRRQILLVPQNGPVPIGIPPTPPPRTPVAYAPPAGRTFFQTFGHTDFKYTVGPRPKYAKHDQVNVNVGANGVSEFHVTSDPAQDYVNFSISISGKGKGPQPVRQTLRPLVKSTPLPIIPSPEPLPTPEPVLTPEPLATPVETPEPTPEPIPAPTNPDPGTVLSFRGAYPVSVTESASSHDFVATGASVEGASIETRFGGGSWLWGLDVDHHRLAISDEQTANRTAHNRNAYHALTGFGYRFRPAGTEQMIGLGYTARYLNVSNIAFDDDGAEQTIPGPEAASPLTAESQLYHGPAAFARLDFPLFGPLGLEAKGGAAYMFGAMDAPAGVTPMLAYWATPSLYLRFGWFQLTGGYDLSMASGANKYNFNRSGPLARIDMRF